jgi:putative phosphoribosyl transferase
MLFRNRSEAGKILARFLGRFAHRDDVLVLALPRGGVPVAYEVAKALGAPLDVFIVRKLGLPGQEELAMGAIASGGVRVLNDTIIEYLKVPQSVVDSVAKDEQREIERREWLYRDGLPMPEVRGHTVILVDDGLATGSTMRAAAAALRKRGPTRIVVAVPVASAEACADFESEVDECVCAAKPDPFFGVGHWYADFAQTGDTDVRRLLARAARPRDARAGIL